jgi:hypothetical protein
MWTIFPELAIPSPFVDPRARLYAPRVVRVFVLYEQEPPADQYAEHVELCRREVPEATLRHGRILGSPQGEPEYRYYFEFELPDRDAWKRSQDGLVRSAQDAEGLGVPFKAFFAEVD